MTPREVFLGALRRQAGERCATGSATYSGELKPASRFSVTKPFFIEELPRRITAALAVGYALLLKLAQPQGWSGTLDNPMDTVCFRVDSVLFAGHTYRHAIVPGFDPEGLMSTAGAGHFHVAEYLLRKGVPEATVSQLVSV